MIKRFIILLFFSVNCYGQTLVTVPTGVGGAVDSMARKFVKYAEIKTGTPFVVENIPGVGGNIGVSKFLNSPPNSLMITSSSWYLSVNEGKFNAEDFKPIAILAEMPFLLITNSNQKLTCKKLKSPNNRYLLGTATMSITEIVGKLIIEKQPQIENVPYKSVKPATLDLLGDHINLVIIGSKLDAIAPLTIIANSSDHKINGIPTFSECLGVYSPVTLEFLVITNKTSDDKFVESISVLVTEFLKDKEMQNYYQENIMYSTSTKNINSRIQTQLKAWKRVTK